MASKMDGRCKTAHAKLLAGTCPWCGCSIVEGKVEGQLQDDLGSSPTESDEPPLSQTLANHLPTKGVLSIAEAVGILRAIAHQLASFHQVNAMHGRLSPRNIGLKDNGVILRDAAAISKRVELQPTLADADEIAGYLAPEQALGAVRADRRADIYSLGCVLYFLLVGRPPFATGSVSERLLQHQTDEPPPLETVRENVPVGLQAICRKMLAKKPEHRDESATEVLQAIEAWQAENR